MRASGQRRSETVRGALRKNPAGALTALGIVAGLGFSAAFILGDQKRRVRPSRVAAGGAIATTGMAGAFALLGAILNHDRVIRYDRHLHNYFRQHRSAAQQRAVKAGTAIGSPWSTTPIGIAAAVEAARRKDHRTAAAILLNLAGSAVLAKSLKGIVQRERPSEGAEDKDEYSFPSGHTLMTAALFALLAYLLASDDDVGPWRYAAAGTAAAVIPWTAFSRMYLGMHWPSDTVASAALATAWDAVLITFLRAK